MKRTLVTVSITLSLILGGCSNHKKSSAETTKGAAPTNTSAVRTTSDPSTPKPLGATLTVIGTEHDEPEADVTVFAVNPNIAPDAPTPPSGGHWVGADAQTCLKKSSSAFTVSWTDWSVSDANHGQYQANGEMYREFPTPQYPFSPALVAVGECVRGWVVFPVAGDTEITTVKYQPRFNVSAFWSAT